MADQRQLHVKVVGAQRLKEATWIKAQRPFCEVQCGGVTMRTQANNRAPSDPMWGEEFSVPCHPDDAVMFSVSHEGGTGAAALVGGGDALVGRGAFSLRNIRPTGKDAGPGGGEEQSVAVAVPLLAGDGQHCGDVIAEMHYEDARPVAHELA